MAVAMPNKRAKAELIVQKLSEIWINNIYFRPSERSILKERNDKKLERLEKISQEAVEQSRWREIPKIEFIKDISQIIQDKKIIIFDKSDNSVSLSSSSEAKDLEKQNIIWIIGPEWWLTKNDYQKFWNDYQIKSLWDTILRMETASIVGAWVIKNIE
jgi:16S rRNA (uracil1498-N3)-methyltransferase